MLEIEIIDKETNKIAYAALPASKFEVNDAMDIGFVFGEVMLQITECEEIPELSGITFKEPPTLEELNCLAKRIEEISEDPTLVCAYRALLQKPFDTINEAINRTFNLKSIPVITCANAEEYGKIVLENGMLEELEEIPDELIPLLDLKKIGELAQDHDGGVFIDGYYAATNCYDPVLEYDDELPEPMEDWVFKIEVAGVPARPEDYQKMKREILILPADEDHMRNIAETLGEKNIEYCNSMKFESAIPRLQDGYFESLENIYELNAIAWKYSELSREEAAKFKAVLEHERPQDLQGVDYLLSVLDEYEFDNSITNPSEFGQKYLSKFLPENFDKSLLTEINFYPLGDNILRKNNCVCNDYGFISERGGHLYTIIEAPNQESQNFFEMGGIS